MHSGMQVVEAAWAADDDEVGAGESKEATERTALALEGKPPRRIIPEDPAARDAAAPAPAAADEPVTRGPLLTFFVTVTGTTILAATLLAFAHAAAIYTYVAQPAASASSTAASSSPSRTGRTTGARGSSSPTGRPSRPARCC